MSTTREKDFVAGRRMLRALPQLAPPIAFADGCAHARKQDTVFLRKLAATIWEPAIARALNEAADAIERGEAAP